MKITLEQGAETELEVIIRGDLTDSKVQELLKMLQAKEEISKLFLTREERDYLYNAKDIAYFEAKGNHVTAWIDTKSYEARYKLYELADGLAGKGFVQISKGVVVNINYIYAVEAEFSGNYLAFLKDGTTKLIISRNYLKAFRKYIKEA